MKWVFKTEYQPPPVRPVKAVSLKKICCFFVVRLRSRPFCPVRIVVVSEREIFLPQRLAFLIFVRSRKQRENCPPRLVNFKTRCCREWKEKNFCPAGCQNSLSRITEAKKILRNLRSAGSWRPLKCIFSGKGKRPPHSGPEALSCPFYVRKNRQGQSAAY